MTPEEEQKTDNSDKKQPKATLGRRIARVTWKTIKWTLISVLLLLVAVIILLQFPGVQTYAAQKASAWLSDELKTKVSIDKVKLSFFSEVELDGIFLQDMRKDTLLYGGNINVTISDFDIGKKYLALNITEIKDVTAKVIRYKQDEHFNFQFLVDYFTSEDTLKKKDSSAVKLDYGKVIIDNFNLVYADRNDTTTVKGMKFTDIHVTGLSGNVSDIDIQKDTILLTMKDFKLKEKSGLDVQRLEGIMKISPTEIKADSLFLKTSETY